MAKLTKFEQLAEATYLEMMDTLNRDSKYKYTKDSYKIIAHSGDKSCGGMCHIATTYNIPKEQFVKVDKYIDIEELFSYHTSMSYVMGRKPGKCSNKVWDTYMEVRATMEDIFEDKWDYRSSWCWIETPQYVRQETA